MKDSRCWILVGLNLIDSCPTNLVADVYTLQNHSMQQELGDWVAWLCLAGMMMFAINTPFSATMSRIKNAI